MLNLLDHASHIAIRDLRKCYDKYGILAGRRRFDDYWARDSFFASLGCTKIGDYEIVKKNLELFLKYQKEDGQLPRRIDTSYVPWKYFLRNFGIKPIRKRLVPRYTTSILVAPSTDQNSLFIVSLSDYISCTKDKSFFKNNFEKIKKTMDWNFTQIDQKDGLIKEGFFAG